MARDLTILKDYDLFKHAGIMFIASLVGGACNYVYQLYMGRALGPKDYGVFGSLFALSYLIFVVTSTIQKGGARFVSKFIGEDSEDKIEYFIHGLSWRMLLLGIAIFLFFILISGWLSSSLKIESNTPVIILGSIFLFSTILPVNLGALQGLQKFGSLGLNTVIYFASKLLFGVFLVTLGFGVNGAIGGMAIGCVIALAASAYPLKTYYFSKNASLKPNFKFSEVYKYSIPTMVAMFCFAVPANVDVIIAKHFFAAETAGLYTAASVLGKIILFIPGAIAMAMFPKVSQMHAEKKDTQYLLNMSLLYTIVISGIVAAAYWFFPFQVIRIPFGIQYLKVAPVVQVYGLVMLFFSLTVVLMHYCLATHNVRYVYLFAFFTFLQILLLIIFHSSMMQMAMVLLTVNATLFISSLCYVKPPLKKARRWLQR
jgi:O-antigen/teichoic acid export membrane protein